jgi:hypothetical protein
VVPIVLVVVLVLVIEKAEYVLKIRWCVEDEYEYKDEYESPAGCAPLNCGFGILEFGFIEEWIQAECLFRSGI